MRTLFGIRVVVMLILAFGQSPGRPADGRSGFDLSRLDTTANPCVDFYQYACGGWRAKNPLPADKARYGTYDEMAERNRERLRNIVEEAAKLMPGQSAVARQVGDYYAACMDEASANKKGAAPLQPFMQR